MSRTLLVMSALLLSVPTILAASTSTAQAGLKPGVKITKSSSTKLRITGIRGHATVYLGRTVKRGATPAIFKMPSVNRFVTVKITSGKRVVWNGRVELRPKRQTHLYFKATAKPKPAPKRPAYAGFLFNAASARTCLGSKRKWIRTVRFDVMAGKKLVSRKFVKPGRNVNLRLWKGAYTVNIYTPARAGSNKFVYGYKQRVAVTKNGWRVGHRCQ